jgi:mono/diheme cytochrome c family protein/glucose/arabinose dehydrogenase
MSERTKTIRAWLAFRAGVILLLALATSLQAAYRIENVALPAELQGGISAVAFTPKGSLVVATRFGEIWMQAADTHAWRRFAFGLNEPLGLVAESESVVFIAHRPELLRAADSDGDGRADDFTVLNGSWGLSSNYHEFFFGLRRDRDGNFYGALSLESTGDKLELDRSQTRSAFNPEVVTAPSFHRSELKYRGWAVKVTPDGKLVPLASGLRQPNGVGLSPEGEMFVTDNQGDWKPSCGLIHVSPGDFLGHASSLKWEPGFRAEDATPEKLWQRYKGPAVVFPHGPMGVSSGEPVWDLTGGKFGAFDGQVFVGDFTSLIMRANLEQVAGGYQGAVFPFIGRADLPGNIVGERLATGNTRMAFAPDGSLYVGQTGGWGGGTDGLQRISWDGKPSAEILDVKLTDRGFALRFTQAMTAATLGKPENYEINRFRFYYHVEYGSPWIDEARVAVKEVRVSADGRSAELILSELKVGFVYEISVPSLRTTEGTPLANPIGYYTANRLRTGEVAVGGTTRLPLPGEKDMGAKEEGERAVTADAMVAAGEKVYRLYCVACHQANGHGIPGGAANFVEDKTRLAKTDEQLLESITRGIETKGMPAFGASLSKGQMRSALAYIRATFGDKKNAAETDKPE